MEAADTSPLLRLPDFPDGKSGWPWATSSRAPANSAGRDWPRITVVTPSFQQSAYLEECIRSVLMQGYPNLEYIVIDGGSTDGSVEILKKYEAYLSYWQSEKDAGQGDAINQGFDRSTGDILGWINSDDLMLPGALFAVGRTFMLSNSEIVYGDALNAFEDDRTLQYWQAYWLTGSFLQFGGVISSHAIFWRRAAHVPIWSELNCNIDGELWRRLIPRRRVHYIPQPLGVCRVHSETKSNADRWRELWRQDRELVEARHGKETKSRVLRHLFNRSQLIFKWFTWRRNIGGKRSVLEACGWADRGWRGPRP
jgi:glycosyltransferase involved in cell wall biosynthesis